MMMMQGLVGQTLSLEQLFYDYCSLFPLCFPLAVSHPRRFSPRGTRRLLLSSSLMMLSCFPAETAPATWEYVHPAFPHLPKYIKSIHCPRPPLPTSDIRSFWKRLRVYMSTPGIRTQKSYIMDTMSRIGVGFIHFPPTIAGATHGTAVDPVSIDTVHVDPAQSAAPSATAHTTRARHDCCRPR